MATRNGQIVSFILALMLFTSLSPAVAQAAKPSYLTGASGKAFITQQQLLALNGAPGDEAGVSVAIDGDTAVIGSYLDDVGSNINQGSAHVFVRVGTTWSHQQVLVASNGSANASFGWGVAVSGDTIAVGTTQANSIYIFRRSGSTWVQTQIIGAPASTIFFGTHLRFSGQSLFASSHFANGGATGTVGNAGRVYVYNESGPGTYTLGQTLTAPDGLAGDYFGITPSIQGDNLLVGAAYADVGGGFDRGAVYYFRRISGVWTFQQKILAPDGSNGDLFGNGTAIAGNLLAVGAFGDDSGSIANHGSVYLYELISGTWTYQGKINAPALSAGDEFGQVVRMDAKRLYVSAPLDDVSVSDQGTVQVYVKAENTWAGLTHLQQFVSSSPSSFGRFGFDIGISGDSVVVGAVTENVSGAGSRGAAYVFVAESTTTTITADLPDPSGIGQSLPVEVTVIGANTRPASGQVTVTASTGETCTDLTATAGSGTSALFGCSLTFTSVGPRTLTAAFSNAATHANSTSSPESHAVIATLTVAPVTLPDGVFGSSYAQTLTASGIGSTAPYTYAVSSGTLPPGLLLDTTTGELSGIPTAAGGYSFAVTASDSSSPMLGGPFTGTRNYMVGIARADQVPIAATASPSTIAFGGASSLGTSGGSGTGAVSFAITAGETFCSVSGTTLIGTGVGTCTITATKAADTNYNAAIATVDVTVSRADQAALTATASPATIVFGGSSTLAATGGTGTGAVSFAVTAGASFCSLNGTTLTGTAVGTCTITATKAADANYNAATATVDVTVNRADQAALTATASPAVIVFGGSSTLGAAGGTGTGAVSFAVTAGATFCSVSGTTLTGTGVGTCTVTATKAADANYNAATATVDVTVNRANQAALTATASPAVIVFGGTSTLGTTGGSGAGAVSFAVTAGAAFCSLTGSTLTGTGVGTCTVTATKAADANYNEATATVDVTVNRANQAALTASASPAAIAFGGSSTLDTAGGTGTGAVNFMVTAGGSFCSVSGTTLTGTGVGTCTITATKAADANYNAATATVDVTVNRANQAALAATASPNTIAFGGAGTLGTSGGSGSGPVSFAVTAGETVCSVSGSTLTGTGVGTCTVTATKAADANYNAATATVDVTVNRANQAALTATASPAVIVFGGTSTLGTTGGSGAGVVSFAVTAGAAFCSVTGSTLTGTGVGTCTVTATKAADANYNAATATVDVTVNRASQATLTATASPVTIPFGGTSTLGTTGGSGAGAVSFAVTAGAAFCSLAGNTLTGTGVGTCTVTATKAADANYNAATATVDVTVNRASQATLTATASPSTIVFGGSSTLGTTGGSGTGAVSFAVTSGETFCSVSGNTLTGTAVGVCTITATKAADVNYNAATATIDVAVNRANQAPLTLTATPAAVPLTRTAALSVAGGSGTGAISYAVTAGGTSCSISGTTLTGTGVGTCTITATKAADAEYNAATAQTDVVIQAATDLEVSKTDGTPWAIPDSTVLYEIRVANAGPLAVQGARLRDLLPAGLVDGLWTCAPVQLATCPQAAGTGGIDQLLDLPVNGILRYQLSARVTAPLGSMLTNTATVEVPATVIELESTDNSASDTNSVVPEGIFWNGFEPLPKAISVPSGGR